MLDKWDEWLINGGPMPDITAEWPELEMPVKYKDEDEEDEVRIYEHE